MTLFGACTGGKELEEASHGLVHLCAFLGPLLTSPALRFGVCILGGGTGLAVSELSATACAIGPDTSPVAEIGTAAVMVICVGVADVGIGTPVANGSGLVTGVATRAGELLAADRGGLASLRGGLGERLGVLGCAFTGIEALLRRLGGGSGSVSDDGDMDAACPGAGEAAVGDGGGDKMYESRLTRVTGLLNSGNPSASPRRM